MVWNACIAEKRSHICRKHDRYDYKARLFGTVMRFPVRLEQVQRQSLHRDDLADLMQLTIGHPICLDLCSYSAPACYRNLRSHSAACGWQAGWTCPVHSFFGIKRSRSSHMERYNLVGALLLTFALQWITSSTSECTSVNCSVEAALPWQPSSCIAYKSAAG